MFENQQKRIAENAEDTEKNIDLLISDLEGVLSIESPSGEESELKKFLGEKLKAFGYEPRLDEKGNLWVESNEKAEGKILLSAHLDRVGHGTIKKEGETIIGRLDDALGISMILSLIREGFRPSIVFTVEEESQKEFVGEDGKTKLKWRKLSKDPLIEGQDLYSAGARGAVLDMWDREDKPKLVITVDLTSIGNPGSGPSIYTSSGTHAPLKQFYFKPEVLKDIGKGVNKEGIGVRWVEGNVNDSIEFTFVPGLGVTAIEVPISNMHTNNEIARISDIERALKTLRIILENAENLPESYK